MINKQKRRTVVFLFMIIVLICVILISLAWGQIKIPITTMLAVIGGQVGVTGIQSAVFTPEQAATLWHIRLPRLLVGLLVGAALGVSGAVMQGVFGNSLADPGIIGVSSGAAFGAVIAIALGFTANNIFYLPFFALAGALLAVTITILIATREGKIPVMVLLLAGVAVSMMMGALTSGILTFMNEYRLREFLFWLVGGLEYRRWEHVYLVVGPVITGTLVLCLLARHLNILALGETEAKSVGASTTTLRLIFLFVAAMTTASAVCVSGTIGFVGLVVPHIMRILIGPGHRTLLPACALAGGLFLVMCDTLGRLIIPPTEIRVGIMTALMGAPYFLHLLRRVQKGGSLY